VNGKIVPLKHQVERRHGRNLRRPANAQRLAEIRPHARAKTKISIGLGRRTKRSMKSAAASWNRNPPSRHGAGADARRPNWLRQRDNLAMTAPTNDASVGLGTYPGECWKN
jgi:hypothetical protein